MSLANALGISVESVYKDYTNFKSSLPNMSHNSYGIGESLLSLFLAEKNYGSLGGYFSGNITSILDEGKKIMATLSTGTNRKVIIIDSYELNGTTYYKYIDPFVPKSPYNNFSTATASQFTGEYYIITANGSTSY